MEHVAAPASFLQVKEQVQSEKLDVFPAQRQRWTTDLSEFQIFAKHKSLTGSSSHPAFDLLAIIIGP